MRLSEEETDETKVKVVKETTGEGVELYGITVNSFHVDIAVSEYSPRGLKELLTDAGFIDEYALDAVLQVNALIKGASAKQDPPPANDPPVDPGASKTGKGDKNDDPPPAS